MAKKQYLDLTGLTIYDEQIKAYIDTADAATSTKLTSGTIVVKEAEHADSADEATHATSANSATTAGSATKATQDGNGKNIASTYETKTDASSKLTEAKGYTDTAVGKIADGTTVAGKATKDGSGNTITSTYETKADATAKLTEAKGYADTAATTVKNDLLNGAGAAYDTLKELGDLIDDNADAIELLNDVAAGKADAEHDHNIADVTGLQDALNAKAAQTSLDSHTGNTTVHITSTERTNWNAAKTHADSAHAPSNAQPNQNAFSNIAVNGQTTVQADTTTDTVTFAGSNVAITTNATSDTVTFTVADGSTSAKGLLQLTDGTSSSSTTTAATPKAVKSAYDLANTAKTNAATAQSAADGAQSTANEAKSAAAANTQSITAHTSSINTHTSQITALQGLVGEGIEAIPTASITALFSA